MAVVWNVDRSDWEPGNKNQNCEKNTEKQIALLISSILSSPPAAPGPRLLPLLRLCLVKYMHFLAIYLFYVRGNEVEQKKISSLKIITCLPCHYERNCLSAKKWDTPAFFPRQDQGRFRGVLSASTKRRTLCKPKAETKQTDPHGSFGGASKSWQGSHQSRHRPSLWFRRDKKHL